MTEEVRLMDGLNQHALSPNSSNIIVVSPGSLHMNTGIENIVCVHRVC